MKKSFKSYVGACLSILGLSVCIAGCDMSVKSLAEEGCSAPDINEGDFYEVDFYNSGVHEIDWYYFESANAGTIIINGYTDSESSLGSLSFEYNSDNALIKIEGDDETISYKCFSSESKNRFFNIENAYVRSSDEEGLYATFTNGTRSIKLKSNGKVVITSGEKVYTGVSYKNEDGKITLSDSSDELTFYYLSDGYLVAKTSTSYFSTEDKICLYYLLDGSTGTEKLPAFFETLPDSLEYKIHALTSGNICLSLVKDLLDENSDKKMYLDLSAYGTNGFVEDYGDDEEIKEIPSGYLNDHSNLYSVSLNSYKLESLGKNTFENCTNLESVGLSFSKSFVIRENCFKGCTNLTEVTSYGTKQTVSGTKSDGTTVTDKNITSEVTDSATFAKLLTGDYCNCKWTLKRS